MERRLVMINKPTNATTSSNADVPRVGGEDDVRGCDIDFRVGGEDDVRGCDPDFRVAGVADAREVVDDQPLSAPVAKKS
jgi:hypothetical protein